MSVRPWRISKEFPSRIRASTYRIHQRMAHASLASSSKPTPSCRRCCRARSTHGSSSRRSSSHRRSFPSSTIRRIRRHRRVRRYPSRRTYPTRRPIRRPRLRRSRYTSSTISYFHRRRRNNNNSSRRSRSPHHPSFQTTPRRARRA
jgi:hypothetical protein